MVVKGMRLTKSPGTFASAPSGTSRDWKQKRPLIVRLASRTNRTHNQRAEPLG